MLASNILLLSNLWWSNKQDQSVVFQAEKFLIMTNVSKPLRRSVMLYLMRDKAYTSRLCTVEAAELKRRTFGPIYRQGNCAHSPENYNWSSVFFF